MGKLKTYQQQLQGIVDRGINAAEEQQKKISAKPFNFAEKLENDLRAYSVKTLRRRYYGYSDEVFDQLRSLNSRFSNFAGDLVAKLEREATESTDAISEAAESAVTEVSKTARKAASKVSDTTEEVASDVSEAADHVASEVSEAAEDVGSDISSAAQDARKSVEPTKPVARKTTSTTKKSTAST